MKKLKNERDLERTVQSFANSSMRSSHLSVDRFSMPVNPISYIKEKLAAYYDKCALVYFGKSLPSFETLICQLIGPLVLEERLEANVTRSSKFLNQFYLTFHQTSTRYLIIVDNAQVMCDRTKKVFKRLEEFNTLKIVFIHNE